MKRRLHVHHLITKLELGGAQQNTLYCVQHHDRKRFRVSLGAGPGGMLDREARSIRHAKVVFFKHLRREVRPWDDVRFYLSFTNFLRDQQVDILHTHSSKAGILGRLAAARARTPVVIHTVHGWGFHDDQPSPVRSAYIGLERLAARHTHLLFAVSRENLARGLKEKIGTRKQYRIVRSGIDIAAYRRHKRSRLAVRRSLGLAADAAVVGTVGNFKPQKDPLDFIRAAARIAQAVPQAKFVMVGDGELRTTTVQLAKRLGLGSRVVFARWRRDIPDLLHAFDVFALSSLFEGLPRSVLQAAAAGLPVVATAAGGTSEAIRHGVTGYVVGRRDMTDLSAKVISLLKNPQRARRMGRAGRFFIGGEFEIKNMLHDIETHYLTLAERAQLI